MKELLALFSSFFKIGIMTFGGGYAMLPMLERELVLNKKWITTEEIMDYFAIGQCTPGVIAVNTATFIGYKRKKIIGGIVATLGVIAPSIIIISLLAGILDMFSDNKYVKHAFAGISIAVCALLVQSVIKMGKSAIKDGFTTVIALLAFALALLFNYSPLSEIPVLSNLSPIIIVVAAGIAACIYKSLSEQKKQNGSQENGGRK